MKYLKHFSIALLLLTQETTAQRLELNKDSLKGLHFSIEQLDRHLNRSLTDSAVGWAYQVWQADKLVASGAGGFKIRPSDTEHGAGSVFSADTRMHIASLSKSITALAIAKLVQLKRISWDSEVKQFLPSYWQLHPGFAKLRLRELLTMTSGLDRPLDAQSSSFDSLQNILARGPNPDKVGKFNYQNTAYGLLRIIIAYLDGFKEFSPGVAPGASALATANVYSRFINEHILSPSGIAHADCNETSTEPAMRYSFPPDSLPGELTGSGDGNLLLSAGGFGWYLSASDIGKLLNAVFYTRQIISPVVLQELVDMGFPFRIRQSRFGSYFGTGGDWGNPVKPNGWAGIHTYFICFPDDIRVIVFTNSGEGSPSSKILRAYRNAFSGGNAF